MTAPPPPPPVIAQLRELYSVIGIAIEQARCSPCRSQRGAAVFRARDGRIDIFGRGHNRPPDGFECDGSPGCKASCRITAIHAEQQALLNAGINARHCELVHVKVVDGALVPSGCPSCVQCSKLALAAGIAGVWLYHADGWRRYPADEFHRLSLAHSADLLSSLQARVEALETESARLATSKGAK